MKYRAKPVIIEAEQFRAPKPVRGMTMWPDEGVQPRDTSWGYVTTIHGQQSHIHHLDYIVPEPDGEHFYNVKPDIFEAKYEPVDEGSPVFRPGYPAERAGVMDLAGGGFPDDADAFVRGQPNE